MRRGKDAAKGATVIFWRLAGGEEDELLALRVLLVFEKAIIYLFVIEDFLFLLAPETRERQIVT